MSVICLSCDGWGCESCRLEREAAQGGEQGLTASELEVEQLRAALMVAKAERDAALELVVDQLEVLVAMKAERDGALTALAVMRSDRGLA